MAAIASPGGIATLAVVRRHPGLVALTVQLAVTSGVHGVVGGAESAGTCGVETGLTVLHAVTAGVFVDSELLRTAFHEATVVLISV